MSEVYATEIFSWKLRIWLYKHQYTKPKLYGFRSNWDENSVVIASQFAICNWQLKHLYL
jgi:hypothetical protein